MHTPSSSARAESRRRPTLTRTLVLLASGLFILTGVVVLPAFALENEGDPASTSTTGTPDGEPAPDEAPADTTTSTTLSPEDEVVASLAAMTDEERRVWDLYTMTPEEREAFGRLLSPPEPEPEPAPAPRAAAPSSPSGVWDRLAVCEAGGNWAHAPVGSYGYSGGLMFLPSTWRAYGGGEFAAQAYQAGRDAQIVVAERILASHGGSYRAWPGCRAKLGLP